MNSDNGMRCNSIQQYLLICRLNSTCVGYWASTKTQIHKHEIINRQNKNNRAAVGKKAISVEYWDKNPTSWKT